MSISTDKKKLAVKEQFSLNLKFKKFILKNEKLQIKINYRKKEDNNRIFECY